MLRSALAALPNMQATPSSLMECPDPRKESLESRLASLEARYEAGYTRLEAAHAELTSRHAALVAIVELNLKDGATVPVATEHSYSRLDDLKNCSELTIDNLSFDSASGCKPQWRSHEGLPLGSRIDAFACAHALEASAKAAAATQAFKDTKATAITFRQRKDAGKSKPAGFASGPFDSSIALTKGGSVSRRTSMNSSTGLSVDELISPPFVPSSEILPRSKSAPALRPPQTLRSNRSAKPHNAPFNSEASPQIPARGLPGEGRVVVREP
jgi:hypothetical protein